MERSYVAIMATKKSSSTAKGTTKKAKKPAAPDFAPQTTSLPAFPNVPSKALAGLAAKVKKAKDEYRKRSAIEELVEYRERPTFYGALLRHSVVPFWDEPSLWDTLASERKGNQEAITPKDVAFLLSRIKQYGEKKGYEPTLVLPSWPAPLDNLVLPAYLEDPAAFADYDTWAEPVKKGFLTVLVRAGALGREALGPSFTQELAKLHLKNYGLPYQTNFVQEGAHWVYDEMYGKDQLPTQDFWDFINLFTTKEDFLRALDEAASEPAFLNEHNSCLMTHQIDVLRQAPIERLAIHLSKTGLDDSSTRRLHALFQERSDTPADLFKLCRLLKESDSLKSEVALVAGILRAKEKGEAVPKEMDKLFSMDSIQMGYKPIDPIYGRDELLRALEALGKARAKAVVKAVLEHEYRFVSVMSVLAAFADESDLVDRAFERLKTYKYTPREIYMGIALFAPKHLGKLAEQHERIEKEGGPVRAELIRRGLQGLLAKAAQRGERWDAEYDRFLNVHGFENDIDGKPSFNVDYDFGHYIAPVLLVAVTGLDAERRKSWLKANFDPAKPSFARILACIPRDDDALIREAFELFAPHHEKVRMVDRDWLTDLAQALGERAYPHARFLLETTQSQRFRKSFESALGKENLEKALQGSAAASMRAETKVEKILRLSKSIEGPTETITILETARYDEDDENDEEPAPLALSHVGGPGFDLGEKAPMFSGERMTHILTLATADIPHLKASFPGAAAISLYVANPEMNEAFEPYNKEAAVLALTEEDLKRPLAEPTSQDLSPENIRITTIEVPSSAFYEDADTQSKELRDAIYRLPGRAGGEPLWLQYAEEGGTFLFQFDEGLASINLGDCGVMYVFDDTAFWQCY